MDRILAGIETEYGLLIEGRGAEDQIDDATALVRGYPGECLPIWDYRHESPRADLRGFMVDRLETYPEDAKFDAGRARAPEHEVRADRILANGARLYNDHAPEYSTPGAGARPSSCCTDQGGGAAALMLPGPCRGRRGAGNDLQEQHDFHGASYGTHENYSCHGVWASKSCLVGRADARLRQILCGAGKVAARRGRRAPSAEPACGAPGREANVETLFRRPVFNTRDERMLGEGLDQAARVCETRT